MHFWMEKGVKGFRFDVINLISKAGFEDDFSVDGDGRSFYTDGLRIHEFLPNASVKPLNLFMGI